MHIWTAADSLSLYSSILLITAVSEMFKEEYNANFGVLLSFSEHKTLPATNGQVSISNYILSHFTGT